MRTWTVFLICLGLATGAVAGDVVPIPWEEFKTLYRESIRREVAGERPAGRAPSVQVLEAADFEVSIQKTRAEGRLRLSGRRFSGDPAPMDLLGREILPTRIHAAEGAALLPDAGGKGPSGLRLLPQGKGPFSVDLSFLLPVREDRRSRYISMALPPAIQVSLDLDLSDDLRLLAQPGIADAAGRYHLSGGDRLMIRFAGEEETRRSAAAAVDAFTRFRFQAGRIIGTTWFAPSDGSRGTTFRLVLPAGSTYLSTSLKPSWIRPTGKEAYAVRLPDGAEGIFSVRYGLAPSESGGAVTLSLPVITGNQGDGRSFGLVSPEDGEIILTGAETAARLSVDRLHPGLREAAGGVRHLMVLPEKERIAVALRRFETAADTPLVLGAVHLFVAVEENGGRLTVLRLSLPPEAGPRFSVRPLPGAEIWSLKVNNRDRKVYAGASGDWIIPLDEGRASLVELALLERGERLGLRGRLEFRVPETGIPARILNVGLSLPERIELTSLEGPLSPAPGKDWDPPPTFVGTPHHFSRAFYRGEGMKVAVGYREPMA